MRKNHIQNNLFTELIHSLLRIQIKTNNTSNMKSLALFALILLIGNLTSRALVAEYFFTQQNLTYTEISGGTTLWSGTFDNEVSGEITIPSFTFNGTAYTSLYVSANGHVSFGMAPVSSSYTPISATTAYTGAISAFGSNLVQAESGSPEVRYQQVGNEFVVQWKDVRRSGVTGEIISFQIRLNTSNNYVSIVYGGTITPGSSTSYYPQVGLRGASNSDYNNRYIINTGGNWINSTAGTGNSRNMYFNSTTLTVVPTAGLTYSWKPLYNPNAFTATATCLDQIDLSWIKNSIGHNVMLAYNTTTTFGTPVNGTSYIAGNPIAGGGTVLFYGDGSSLNHTSLSPNTAYYYKIWSFDGVSDYSTGTTSTTRTANALPYLQDFNASSMPAEWNTNLSLTTSHGTGATRCLSKAISSGSVTYYAISPLVGSITANTKLSFNYRIVDNLGYPFEATVLGASDKIEIQVSLDDGATFSTIHTIDQSNHINTTEFANKVLSLGAYSGDFIKIRFLCTWGEGNYYVDIDDVLFEDGTNMSYSASTTEQPNTSNVAINSQDNDIIRLQIITQKDANPLSLTSITFNTTGCTNATTDLETAKVYYTTSPVFSAGTQFGTNFSNPSGTFTITGNQALTQGNNYFWLAYDIRSTATAANNIDAQCTQFITSESGTVKIPTAINPTGVRKTGTEISGTKTIPGDYATIAAAVNELNNGVVGSGGAIINVDAGHTESISSPILLTATGTLANPIVFQKNGTGENPLITRTDAGSVSTSTLGSHGDGIIIIEGSDYVTFNGIDVTASNEGIEYGYYLRKASVSDGCKNITVKNATITMNKGTSKCIVGFCAANNSSTSSNITLTQSAGSHENIVFSGNTIDNTFTGVFLKGSSVFYDQNFTIGSVDEPNIIQNFAGNTNYTSYGIYLDNNHDSQISYNTINNIAGSGSAFTSIASGIYNDCSLELDFTAEHNTITLTSVNFALNGIYSESSGDIHLNSNTISLNTSTSSSAEYIFINNNQPSAITSNNTEISNNTFTSSEILTTGLTYLIRNNNARKSPEVTTIQGNQSSSINRTGTSGAFYLYYNGSAATGTENISGNNFSNITLAGSSTFGGIYSSTSASHSQNVYNNTFSNITGGSGNINIIYLTAANTRSVYNNQIYNISGESIVSAIYFGTGSNLGEIYRNKIFNISTSSTSSSTTLVNGIHINSGTSVYIYNNFISDLKTPLASNFDAIRGISITSTLANSLIGVYYNTVYLDASSSGTNFGTSCIYHTANSTATTAVLDLRNNILVNETTPNGGGYSVAFRRSSTTLANYSSLSNNNIFYAGEPGADRLIYTPTSCQTIEAFKTLVGPNRDSLSFTEVPPFANVTTTPYELHLQDGMPSFCESGAQVITTPIAISDDFDGTTRPSTPDIGADEFAGVSAYVEPPKTLSALSLNSQEIELGFTSNENEDDLVIVFNFTGTFTNPTGTPVEGNSLAGGTVLYSGSTSPVTHSGLTPGTTVYYKAFCYNGANYSTGLTANSTPEVTPPSSFTANCAGTDQINLLWTKNGYDHDVIISTNSAYMSGNPVNGTNYEVGNAIPSAGTVIYKGPASAFNHTLLNTWTQYYYKTWSVDSYNYYSTGVTSNAITDANPIIEFPYLQNFDETWSHNPAAPNNWKNVELSGSWSRSGLIAHSLYGASGSGSGATNHYLISPPILLPDTTTHISWWDKVSNALSNNSYKVLLSTTNSEIASFTIELGDFDCTNTSWTLHSINLSAYKGQTVYIAFQHYYCQSQYQYFAIDDVIIETLIPTEAELVFPTEGLLTLINPLLKWKTPVSGIEHSGYKVYLDENSDPTTLVYDGTDLSFQTTGLAYATTYFWKVVPYNANGDAMNVPVWSFSTVSSTQLGESFEADFFPPVGWSQTNSWSHSLSFYQGDRAARGYTYLLNPVKLITPLLTIAPGDHLEFVEGTGSSTHQWIKIMYSPDKATWATLGDSIHVTVAEWGFHSIDLSSLSGNNYYIAFGVYHDLGGASTYVNIDHVTGPEIVPIVPKAATNPNPVHIDDYISTTCTLSWIPDNTGGIPAGYKLYIDTHSNPTSLVYDGADASYAISSLLYNTSYYWKVVPYNSAGDASDSPAWSFTTVPEGAVQIGREDIDYLDLPIEPDYNYSYAQIIYLQSEISIPDKQISKIYFHWNGAEAGNTYKDWVIYMGHTAKTAFSSTSDWVPVGQMTLVFDGEVSLPAIDGWVEIALNTPFEYNNTDNLLIAIDENTPGYANENVFFYGSESSTARGIVFYDDGINPDPASPPTAEDLVEGIANIRLQFEAIPDVPIFKVNPTSKDFGNILLNSESAPQTFTISNNGAGTLSIQSVSKSGTNANQFQLTDANSYPIDLAANESITVSIVFEPNSEGVKSATLNITDNLSGSPHQVSLTGFGVDPLVDVFPFTETFEDDSPTRNKWTQIIDNGFGEWTYVTGAGEFTSITSAHRGTLNARFTQTTNANINKLVSPVFDLSEVSSPQLNFWYAQELWSQYQNELTVYYRTAPEESWVQIFHDDSNKDSWTQQTIELPMKSASYQIAFEGIDNNGRPNVLDDVSISSLGTGTTTPEDTTLNNVNYGLDETHCIGAIQTIIVAGSSDVDFEIGSNVNLIAGHSIQFLPGFHAHAGCLMNAYITTNASFCDELPHSIVREEPKAQKSLPMFDDNQKSIEHVSNLQMKVYPNPNNGRFSVELSGLNSEVQITVYNSTGAVIQKQMTVESQTTFELLNTHRGIIFVRAICANKTLTQKLLVE